MRLKERKCDKAYSSCVLLAQFFEPAKSRTYRSDFQEFSTRYLARSDGALAYIGRGTLALDPCEAESADGCCGYDARRSEPASLPFPDLPPPVPQWVRSGKLEQALRRLAQHLHERG